MIGFLNKISVWLGDKKMKQCRQCGKELPKYFSTDICLECSTKNMKKIFSEYPDIKESFMGTIKELKKELNDK